jgi:hypothetical protein
MLRRIYKGMHYCFSFLNFKPYFDSTKCLIYDKTYKIRFTNSCKYDIGKDQNDINKLFGISYGRHHYQSDRIGWRYKPSQKGLKEIEILLYSYECGVRRSFTVGRFNIGDILPIRLKTVVFEGYRKIFIFIGGVTFSMMLDHDNTKWGYTLGNYFGGNRKAPHTIKIDISNVKQ